jgi:ADP-ribose pyrophosphatase YjhB (NUDIX family)
MDNTENKGCKLVADVAVFSGNKILLVKYTDTNKYDHQKGWFLPDDLINYLEHPEDAAVRILHEQLGLTAEVKLNHIESFKGNDRTWHLVFHYRAEIQDESAVKGSPDLQSCEFFALDNLPDKKEVAHHGWALYTIKDMQH